MISNRPYLLRAFNEWIVDSKCTPILVIDANHPQCHVPLDHAEGGEIVFNVSSSAVRDLNINNENVQFKASFSGVIHLIIAPVKAILALYAEENGEGIFFDAEDDDQAGDVVGLRSIEGSLSGMLDASVASGELAETKSKPSLKLVE